MQVCELCNRRPVTVDKANSILAAAQTMRQNHVGDVIVSESADGVEKPLGVLTDRDIVVEVIAKGVDPDKVTAGDIMSLTIATTQHDADVFETLRFMGIKGIRRIAVVDSSGALFGILSVDDIMRVLAKELGFLADISARQIERERTARE